MNKFIASMKHATNGIRYGVTERNFRIHLVIAFAVVFFGVILSINVLEWVAILLCFGLVMSLELINTAIEELANHIRDELKLPYATTKMCRDVSAGAVLIAATCSGLIGLLIFVPRAF